MNDSEDMSATVEARGGHRGGSQSLSRPEVLTAARESLAESGRRLDDGFGPQVEVPSGVAPGICRTRSMKERAGGRQPQPFPLSRGSTVLKKPRSVGVEGAGEEN